jgi:hypothetical protein
MQDLKVQAYVLLCHAAIEEYLEKLVLDVARQCIDKYHNHNTICRSLIGLISCGLIARIEEKALSKKISEELFQNIGEFSNVAYGRFRSIVGDNNGIKKTDQKKLMLPIGVDPELEDSATMASLDSFGGKRGAIAHGFKIAKTHTLSEIESDLTTIKAGLLNYDGACMATLTSSVII